jgi:hypothetical protein
MTQTPLMALHERARAGDAEALVLTGVAAALGAGEPASWATALDRVRRAAKLGSAFAQDQLTVLAQAGLEAAPQPVAPQILIADPAICGFPGFIQKAACDWLIGRAAGRVAKAETFDLATGSRRADDARSNSTFGFLL